MLPVEYKIVIGTVKLPIGPNKQVEWKMKKVGPNKQVGWKIC